jgi:hypothetical protein
VAVLRNECFHEPRCYEPTKEPGSVRFEVSRLNTRKEANERMITGIERVRLRANKNTT